jgi:hypothetical protein
LWTQSRSEQVMIANADHHYAGVEKDAAKALIDFVRVRL